MGPPEEDQARLQDDAWRVAVRKLVLQDEHVPRAEYAFEPPAGLLAWLRTRLEDPRDEPALKLVMNVVLTTVPASALMLGACNCHTIGVLYLLSNYALYLQRFMLTLHVTQHRRLFKQDATGRLLNALVPYVLCPLYGVPPGMYRLHHVIMHHVEDNRRGRDASSTEAFQRDSLAHFVVYWFRFWVGAWFELPVYAARAHRPDLVVAILGWEAAYWAALAALWRVNWVGTVWVLLAPFLLSTLLLMFGNWSQHVFVDPDSLHDTYRSTYNCVACPDNARSYNDGYHVLHHLNSRTHWSELPARFLATLEQHAAHDALAFHGLGFFDVGLAVFCGRLGYLARHVVPCGPRQAARSHEEWVALLRRRLRPVTHHVKAVVGSDSPSNTG